MKNYWCEDCNEHYQSDKLEKCPKCGSYEVKQTMSEDEARAKGLL